MQISIRGNIQYSNYSTMIVGDYIPHLIICWNPRTRHLEKDKLFDEGRKPNLNRSSLLQDSIHALSRVAMRVRGLLNEWTSSTQTGLQETKWSPNSNTSIMVFKNNSSSIKNLGLLFTIWYLCDTEIALVD